MNKDAVKFLRRITIKVVLGFFVRDRDPSQHLPIADSAADVAL